jgi:hypothetical protein
MAVIPRYSPGTITTGFIEFDIRCNKCANSEVIHESSLQLAEKHFIRQGWTIFHKK